jgi:hypothetical protein
MHLTNDTNCTIPFVKEVHGFIGLTEGLGSFSQLKQVTMGAL